MYGAKEGRAEGGGVKQAKIGRNDPCQCGNKRKFKVCCGKGGV